jgi:glycerophosphoryl diester phosphodiesterase
VARGEAVPHTGSGLTEGVRTGAPLRIAHAYGNTRERLKTALEADVDIIEADVWYRGGEIWVRHERRVDPLPLLVDKRMRGHSLPPLSLPLGRRWYLRLDFNRLKLDELLSTVAGGKGLLLDVKGYYRGHGNLEFAQALVRKIYEYGAAEWVSICGQYWPVLDDLRRENPGVEVRYSVERTYQWEKFMRLVGDDEHVRRVCIEHRFLNPERARFLDERGVDVFCWTVDNHAEAHRLSAAGVHGIISNDLTLLRGLSSPVGNEMDGAGLESSDDASSR